MRASVLVLVLLAPLALAKLAPHYLSVGTGIGMPSAVKDKYHSTDTIINSISELSGRCSVLTKHEVQVTDPATGNMRSTFAYTLTDPNAPKENKKRFMLTFGMHGREYISSETALYLSNYVCESVGLSGPSASSNSNNAASKAAANLVPSPALSAAALANDGKDMGKVKSIEIMPGKSAEQKSTQSLLEVDTNGDVSVKMSHDRLSAILHSTEILFIPVLNIDGRKKLENGDSCTAQRKNGRNVDVNRNFADWFNPNNAAPQDEDYQGPAAMSEWESNVVKTVAERFQPHAYIDIHSGDLGMGYVYGHSGSEKSPDDGLNRMWSESVEREVFGGRVWVGNLANMGSMPYESHGSSCDYMYRTQGARISGTWEVWRKPSFFATASASSASSGSSVSLSKNSLALQPVPPTDARNFDYVSTTVSKIDVLSPSLAKSTSAALQVESTTQKITDELQGLLQSGLGDQLGEKVGLSVADIQTLVQSMHDEGKQQLEIEELLQDMSREQCFAYFNPVMPEHYDNTVRGFTMAVLVGAERLSNPDVAAAFSKRNA